MSLRVVGAGCPRTATSSLRRAFERLLGRPCLHMSAIDGHPFDLGPVWDGALKGEPQPWHEIADAFGATVDWPASLFWRELLGAAPDAVVVLSTRASARAWWESVDATILPYARMAAAPDWHRGRGLPALLERFTGTTAWDDADTLMAAYERHNQAVRDEVPPDRLVQWRAEEGWLPLCAALGAAVPDEPFPWTNRREEWR